MRISINNRKSAVIALIICALLWSTSGFIMKSISTLGSMEVSGLRCLIFSVFMLCVQKKHKFLLTDKWFLTGALSFAAGSFLIVQANMLTTAANAIVLQYIAPVFVCVYTAVFLKKKLDRSSFPVIVAVMAGLVLCFHESLTIGKSSVVGDCAAIAAGAVMGLQAVSVCQIERDYLIRSMLIVGGLLNFLICFPFMHISDPPITDLLWVLFLGIFQMGVAYLLYSVSVRNLSPIEVILIPALEPIVNPILTLIICGETLSVNTIVGGAIVIISIALWSWYKERHTHNENGRE